MNIQQQSLHEAVLKHKKQWNYQKVHFLTSHTQSNHI